MSRIRCFFLEPTDQAIAYRRVYGGAGSESCAKHRLGYCNAEERGAQRLLAEMPPSTNRLRLALLEQPGAIAGWPVACEACGKVFPESAECQDGFHRLFRRGDTGALMTLREAALTPGAMWYAPWLEGFGFAGPDGKHLVCVTPGGEWLIDSRCSNCTLPQDSEHRCWVRHGAPPDVTVDKNGKTCGAGGGSIQQGTYHGFLRAGWLEGA